MSSTVLVVDDKELMRDSVGSTLSRAGFSVTTASDGAAALRAVAASRPDAIVTDLNMPGMSGIDLLANLAEIDDELPVVLMTAYGTIQTAVQAMRNGAFDYITKPFEGDELIISVKRAIRHSRLVRENAVLRSQASASTDSVQGIDRLIGDSPAMRVIKDQMRTIAASHGTVLITGESGTGKEVVARALHDLSPRSGAPFLAVNCAALSESLLESELFGHEKGAFTGADKLRKGRFELASGGSLLLDEVSEVSPQIQAKLLRVLQEQAFERVGSSLTIGVDVRIIATSNRDLPQTAATGEFRQDLFFRLNVLPIHLPPLRDRLEDIPVLVEHFSSQIAARDGRPAIEWDGDALSLLASYPWPGNVRELGNICERAVVLTQPGANARITRRLVEPWLLCDLAPRQRKAQPLHADLTQPVALPDSNGTSNGFSNGQSNGFSNDSLGQAATLTEVKPALPGDRKLADLERDIIVATLLRFNGHRQKTARALGIGVRTLGLKLKKWKELSLVSPNL